MQLSIQILVGLVAVFHLYVLWIEMFAWLSRGPKVFKSIPKELFPPTKVLAANQGLYNGFLAAGLIWSLFICDPHWQNGIRLFFLSCVALAGIYGGMTAGKRIFFVQAVPALVGIGMVLFGPRYCDEIGKKEVRENSSSKTQIQSWLVNEKGRLISERFELRHNNKSDFSDSLFFMVDIRKEDGKHLKLEFFGPSKYVLNGKDIIKVGTKEWGIIYSEFPRIGNYLFLKTDDVSINDDIQLAMVQIIKHKKRLLKMIRERG